MDGNSTYRTRSPSSKKEEENEEQQGQTNQLPMALGGEGGGGRGSHAGPVSPRDYPTLSSPTKKSDGPDLTPELSGDWFVIDGWYRVLRVAGCP